MATLPHLETSNAYLRPAMPLPITTKSKYLLQSSSPADLEISTAASDSYSEEEEEDDDDDEGRRASIMWGPTPLVAAAAAAAAVGGGARPQ